MADLNTYEPITNSGDYDFEMESGRKFVFSASGTFGGGTLTLKYIIKGDEVDFESGVLSAAGGFEVMPPVDTLRITLAGASAPSIDIVLVDSHDPKR
tara:strand:+ start:350 stop:640 length:291 start_codon:yes stop_codon:yes gene_type:complete